MAYGSVHAGRVAPDLLDKEESILSWKERKKRYG